MNQNKVFIKSYHDVVHHVTRALIKPNMKIGLGSGPVILILIDWLIDNAKHPKCKGLVIFCTDLPHVKWLTEAGYETHHNLPDDDRGIYNKFQLDYFFEMQDKMNQDSAFVKFSPDCIVRKSYYEAAIESVFFYRYVDDRKYQPLDVIPLEISSLFFTRLKFLLNSKSACIEPDVPDNDNDILQIKWILKPAKSELIKDMACYKNTLRNIHGIIAHGFFTSLCGYMVEICELSKKQTMYMTTTRYG
ncbi:unnamed protein product [Caenorhabditis sp. 36 PRJEB53466]|nr:unnamed protein product [Caenorhabditis sp. 36 PRJEB53466]